MRYARYETDGRVRLGAIVGTDIVDIASLSSKAPETMLDLIGAEPALHEALGSAARYETLQDSENTLTVLVDGVKISFFQVRDPFIFDTQPYLFFSIADTKEIALMKLIAIANRGSRKDFIDLYTILRDGPVLRDYFLMLPEKYGGERINAHHILKSLTYFADAEEEPPPKMCEPFRWEECKAFFIRESHSIILGD